MICRLVFAVVLFAIPAAAAEWPPADPNEHDTQVNFSVEFAQKVRGFRTVQDLQKAAKAKGKMTATSLGGDDPTVNLHWRGEDGQHWSTMLAVLRPSGRINVTILTDDRVQVIFDNAGGFQCEPASCRP